MLISLKYLPVTFYITFLGEIKSQKCMEQLPVTLRSVLGLNLRSMCCIARGKVCPECLYNKNCSFAFIFETIIPQDNQIAPGTDRATHPFSFSACSDTSFTINLYGEACNYLPYIYAAFFKAGQKGLFKDRIPFKIDDVKIADKSILIDEETIDVDNDSFYWKYDFPTSLNMNSPVVSKKQSEILVQLKSPLRFKIKGKYSTDFTAQDFMQCLFRRAKTLCSLYGTFEDVPFYDNNNIEFEITERNVSWKDFEHYSARQKNSMQLGGVVGTFKLKGKFSDFDLALLDFSRIVNAGKNPNFGLGQIDFWER